MMMYDGDEKDDDDDDDDYDDDCIMIDYNQSDNEHDVSDNDYLSC